MEPAPPPQSDALAAGRRIYLGNLLYSVKPHDVEAVLEANGFGDFEAVHISIDPLSARNPGYCFVDFADAATAQRALSSLSAVIRGRPLKVGPCEPKNPRAARGPDHGSRFAFERWGDWCSSSSAAAAAPSPNPGRGRGEQGPDGALKHFEDMAAAGDGLRVFIGGLGRMVDQAQNHREMSEILAGFTPVAVGKRITPSEKTRAKPGNHHYCFVDFATKEEAQAAIQALNRKPYAGGFLKVSQARDMPLALFGDARFRRAVPREDAGPPGEDRTSQATSRALASRDWRRKGDA